MKENIIVCFGGKSFEHDISIITAVMMLKNYRQGKYNLLPVYISKNNEWFFYAKNNISVQLFKDFENTYKVKGFKNAYLKTGDNHLYMKSICFDKSIEIAGALNCCHGGIGEDGTLTNILSASNIPVTSGNSVSMGVCMDKLLSKYCFDGLKIKTVQYISAIKSDVQHKEKLLENVENLGFPVILKPATLGSSIGIKIANNKEEFLEACDVAFEFDDKILIEKAILDGMEEYNVACLKIKDSVIVSDIDKAKKSDEILSFKDKYIGDENNLPQQSTKCGTKSCGGYLGVKEDFPAKLPEKLKNTLQKISKQVYEKLNFFGVVRFDYIVDKKGRVYLNEINTVPGSLAYYFFVPHIFNTVTDYIDNMIDFAVYNYSEQDKIKKEFITNLI